MIYSLEDIADKAEWEGGLDEALEWFDPEEVPVEIRQLWRAARDLKKQLDGVLDDINFWLPED